MSNKVLAITAVLLICSITRCLSSQSGCKYYVNYPFKDVISNHTCPEKCCGHIASIAEKSCCPFSYVERTYGLPIVVGASVYVGFSVFLIFFIIYSYWQKQKFEDLTDSSGVFNPNMPRYDEARNNRRRMSEIEKVDMNRLYSVLEDFEREMSATKQIKTNKNIRLPAMPCATRIKYILPDSKDSEEQSGNERPTSPVNFSIPTPSLVLPGKYKGRNKYKLSEISI